MVEDAVAAAVGRTPRGVRGLKFYDGMEVITSSGRTPRGVRGLKSDRGGRGAGPERSHPSRGAWIEICVLHLFRRPIPGRTPRGVRGLK